MKIHGLTITTVLCNVSSSFAVGPIIDMNNWQTETWPGPSTRYPWSEYSPVILELAHRNYIQIPMAQRGNSILEVYRDADHPDDHIFIENPGFSRLAYHVLDLTQPDELRWMENTIGPRQKHRIIAGQVQVWGARVHPFSD
ncbi:hypothetical protein PCANC_01762 [Puccinia coronata f. sp. avenae]|uniref:Uncharacterized protein n=1 Tax=Puccinia coronata f. sp. avenae TaxID=200324 RepID=A0A2N5W5B6_9BASI|nr:hypothetical protein PCANC_01762 [Puccinia coronata f. sp. avenae]